MRLCFPIIFYGGWMAEVEHRKIRRMIIHEHVSSRNQSGPRTKVSDEEIRNGIRRTTCEHGLSLNPGIPQVENACDDKQLKGRKVCNSGGIEEEMSGRPGEYNDFRSVPISPVYFFIDFAFLTALVVFGGGAVSYYRKSVNVLSSIRQGFNGTHNCCWYIKLKDHPDILIRKLHRPPTHC